MTLENSSLLGYLFIVIGIVLTILAFAVYLTLRDEKSEKKSEIAMADSSTGEGNSSTAEESSELDTPIIDTPFLSSMNAENELVEEDDKEPKSEVSIPVEEPGVVMSKEQELVSVVTFLREIDTGNLILRIGEKEYTSYEDLQASPHLARIERVYSDLESWLEPASKSLFGRKKAPSKSTTIEADPFKPKSMVEEINDILEQKLREEPGERKAIKLVEMLDGGVNVYIGVDSYPIDEVPFEDVQELIRQSVAEWEQRQ
jgi:ABC-type Na+ efflux pump permease subunit